MRSNFRCVFLVHRLLCHIYLYRLRFVLFVCLFHPFRHWSGRSVNEKWCSTSKWMENPAEKLKMECKQRQKTIRTARIFISLAKSQRTVKHISKQTNNNNKTAASKTLSIHNWFSDIDMVNRMFETNSSSRTLAAPPKSGDSKWTWKMFNKQTLCTPLARREVNSNFVTAALYDLIKSAITEQSVFV